MTPMNNNNMIEVDSIKKRVINPVNNYEMLMRDNDDNDSISEGKICKGRYTYIELMGNMNLMGGVLSGRETGALH